MQKADGIAALTLPLWSGGSLFLSTRARAAAVAVAAVVWAAAYGLLSHALGSTAALVLLALLVAVPVSASKTVTACGLNVLHTVARHEFPSAGQPVPALLYTATATLTAALVGWILSIAGNAFTHGDWLVLAAPVFALAALREFAGPAVPVATSSWQVPARWVGGRLRGAIVFGFFLGSGIATWMPSATFYALAVLSFLLPGPAGIVVMGGYGLIRAAPAFLVAFTPCSSEDIRRRSLELYLAGRAAGGLASFGMAFALAAMYVIAAMEAV